ncbi:phosphotransferase family protein [Brachybacterium subflavum]|uniref:phosphotransferase family protein n=1 Tax=Brachybacterium subflavum TaxID=2585206 RepID=UPI001266139A|nr:phosphotransferase [Brachybacterium subflavum]
MDGHDDAANAPVLPQILEAAGLPTTGRFRERSGWVSRAWVGDEYVVRVNTDPRHHDAYGHEARVVGMLARTDVPHARHIAHGQGPDGPWYISERLPGVPLHEAWSTADVSTRRMIIESLGTALRALHGVSAPEGLVPPWLEKALDGGQWPAFHPPVMGSALRLVEDARAAPDHDAGLLSEVAARLQDALPLFAADRPVLVHGDVHGSNVMVENGRVTGLIDFAEALAQPADAELDTILRWCARPTEFPPVPGAGGLTAASLREVPVWLRGTYPELFASTRLRARLELYDLCVDLAICGHHPEPGARRAAQDRIARLLTGRSHLAGLGL